MIERTFKEIGNIHRRIQVNIISAITGSSKEVVEYAIEESKRRRIETNKTIDDLRAQNKTQTVTVFENPQKNSKGEPKMTDGLPVWIETDDDKSTRGRLRSLGRALKINAKSEEMKEKKATKTKA